MIPVHLHVVKGVCLHGVFLRLERRQCQDLDSTSLDFLAGVTRALEQCFDLTEVHGPCCAYKTLVRQWRMGWSWSRSVHTDVNADVK